MLSLLSFSFRIYLLFQRMRSGKDDVMPSTSTLLFPDLMTRDELVAILKHKFKRIGVNTSKIGKCTDDELLEQFKKFAMPKPQRKVTYFHVK